MVDVRHDGDVPKIVSRGGWVIARGQDRPGYRRYAAPVPAKPEPMTHAQKAQLEAELSELEGQGRAEVVQAIATARGFGDLSENFVPRGQERPGTARAPDPADPRPSR